MNGKFEGICGIELVNSLSEVIIKEQMPCNFKSKVLNVSRLSQGLYTVKVYIDNQVQTIRKIAIIR